eukprot:jgi/Chlat1/61/Chrsp1S03113
MATAGVMTPPAGELPVTERSNELTDDIDMANAEGIVRMLRGCDAQLFAGYKSYPGLVDSEVREAADAVSAVAAEFLTSSKDSVIVLSGAGTSGRIAMQAQEGAEDNAVQAVADLSSMEASGPFGKPYRRVLLVGITCGLSATYIAAQLEYAMSQPHYAVALIGCNLPSLARRVQVSKNCSSFYEVVKRMQQLARSPESGMQQHFLITPVVGPEAITGSTRMKGGTVTKMLLDFMFGLACSRVLQQPLLGTVPQKVSKVHALPMSSQLTPAMPAGCNRRSYDLALDAYQAVMQAVYLEAASIQELMQHAVHSLRAKRHLYYLGSGIAGMVGLIDAAEQVPTFGAHPDDVKGFVIGSESAFSSLQKPTLDAQQQRRTTSHNPSVSNASSTSAQATGSFESPSTSQEQLLPQAERFNEHAETNVTTKAATPQFSMPHFTELVLPDLGPDDTLVVLFNSEHSRQPLISTMVLDLIIYYKVRHGFLLAVVSTHIAPHDRALCVDFDTITEKTDSPKTSRPNGRPVSRSSSSSKIEVGYEVALLAAIERIATAADTHVKVQLSMAAAAPIIPHLDSFGELALKYVLNAVSTGAQVLAGKVYKSRMIDVRISNHKLFARAVRIVSEVAEVDAEISTACLLQVVYDGDGTDGQFDVQQFQRRPVSEHVTKASSMRSVVPMAILLAMGHSPSTARDLLQGGASIRSLIAKNSIIKAQDQSEPPRS